MRLFPYLFFFLLSFPSWGFSSLRARIIDLDAGSLPGEESLAFLSSGQVVKVFDQDLQIRQLLFNAKLKKTWVLLTVDEKRQVLTAHELPTPHQAEMKSSAVPQGRLETYAPSILSSHEEAQKIFSEGKTAQKESQCYSRAHVWSYEWRINHNLYTSKAWLFFTRKYIRKYDFEWWFHVAPYFHVRDAGKVWARVAEVKYAKKPLKLKQWSDIFLRNGADCPVINLYSDYANHPESGWCFIMKSSMYYYRPLDLENLERTGIEKNFWTSHELKEAYNDFLGINDQP